MGFDCYRMKQANFHDKYPEEWQTADSSYDKFARVLNAFTDFPTSKVFHLRSPDARPSGADAFPSLEYDDVLPLEPPKHLNFEGTTSACV